VSKSFKCDNCGEISSIMVHIPKFQIVQAGSDVHAEYLIVVGLGAVTLGVWRRFREFKTLATKLASSEKRRQFHNALCSWHCLRARQRLFRCLDKDYLILKVLLTISTTIASIAITTVTSAVTGVLYCKHECYERHIVLQYCTIVAAANTTRRNTGTVTVS
jgi:hypothetical protein